MKPAKIETHKDKKIILLDLTNANYGPELLEVIENAKSLYKSQGAKSALSLTDVSGSKFNRQILNTLKEFTAGNTPYVKASALVGVKGLLQVAVDAIARFSGRQFKIFDTRQDAIDWLLKQ